MRGHSNKTAFIDMDGVLADFFTAALSAHGRHDLVENWPRGQREMHSTLGMSKKQFWAPLSSSRFWAGIRPYPWAQQLIDTVRNLGYKPVLLSALSLSPCSAGGKARWIHLNLRGEGGKPLRDYILTAHSKSLLAAPGRVLIDDYELNCNDFEIAGGTAILFPAVWNILHGVKNPSDFALSHLKSLSSETADSHMRLRRKLAKV